MPPEWHPHESTWVAWPKDPTTWPDRVAEVQDIFLRMIGYLAPHERVNLLVNDRETEEEIRERLRARQCPPGTVIFRRIPTVDAWIRDYGPNFLLRREQERIELAFNQWGFNAWGNKYENLRRDAEIPGKMNSFLKVTRFLPDMILEGGSVDVNGAGICLTTEQCLLNPNRNPHLKKEEIEQRLKDYLGVEQILWLGEGIVGDDTDGHIDDIARFTGAATVVCAVEEDPAEENYGRLQDNLRRLQLATDLEGCPFQVVTLPMPGPLEGGGTRLPASYANFYIANGVVLAPTFGHPNDERALEILQSLFPTRSVIGIPCEPLVWGLGALHCVTQQQPARVAGAA